MEAASHFCTRRTPFLKVELNGDLNHAVTLLVNNRSEPGSIDCGRRTETDTTQVGITVERPQRMVQEVVSVEAELQFLRLGDIEILEHSKIGVEVRRSVNRRNHGRPVLPDPRREGEAIGIDVLILREVGSGITGLNRVKANIRGAQQRRSADLNPI